MRRSRPALKLAAALILAAGTLIPFHTAMHAASGIPLRYHWVVGQHYSARSTSTTKQTLDFPKLPSLSQSSVEVDQYVRTIAVTKVFPDGSGLIHITYGNVSITTNGKVKKYMLNGYAVEERIGATGAVVNKKIIGGKPAYADLPTDISDPTPNQYPQAPIAEHGTWTQSVAIAPLGSVALHLQILAFELVKGRQVVAVGLSLHQPMGFVTNGLTFKGTIDASGTQAQFVDDGAIAGPSSQTMMMKGTLSGVVQKVKVAGTMTLSMIGTDTPAG